MSAGEVLYRARRALRLCLRWLQVGTSSGRSRPLPPPGPRPSIAFLGLRLDPTDEPIDWSRDYRSSRTAPHTFYGRIDYRDAGQVGDSKYTWELNRHQFLVPWALQLRETHDETLAAWIVHVMLDWIAANPRYVGVNWGSSLELALRILSWGIALDLIRDSPRAQAARPAIVVSVEQQARYIRETLSEFSSANNHLLGELVGLLAVAAFFAEVRDAQAGAAYAWRRVLEEVGARTA